MGLESVELVMAFEEHFGIEIPDEEAEKLLTPGLVIDLVCAKLKTIDGDTCQSQRAFYILRRAVIKILGKKRKELTPKTYLQDLSPDKNCTSWWTQLTEEVQAHNWPTPSRPYWMKQSIYYACLAALFATPLSLYERGNSTSLVRGIVLGFAVTVLLAIMLVLATKPFRTRIPRKLVTLRDLIPYVASSDVIQWDRELIAGVVKNIVINQLDLKESQYSEDADFIKNLGVG
jgi:hypothetical protein